MPEIVMLPVGLLQHHPNNPRRKIGDVTELAESLKVNGVLQNLTVVLADKEFPEDENVYYVVIGNRRMEAAKLAGLKELPCVISHMDSAQQIRTMLTENMQRSDLTIYEQAEGFQMMLDLGDSADQIAEKTGFSASTVRRRINLLKLDKEKFEKSISRGATLEDYAKLDEIEDEEVRNRVLDSIGTANFKNDLNKALENQRWLHRREELEAAISAFAKKIDKAHELNGKHHEMDYVRNYGRWHGATDEVEVPDDAGKAKYYYTVSDSDITLYRNHRDKSRDPEEIARREKREAQEAKERAIDDICERHRKMREDFVIRFGGYKKYINEICAFSAQQMVAGSIYGNVIRQSDVERLLGIASDNDMGVQEIVYEAAEQNAAKTLLLVAYCKAEGRGLEYAGKQWDTAEREWKFGYKPNDDLDDLYDFLTSIGYQMSDEEKNMQNGICELFDPVTADE